MSNGEVCCILGICCPPGSEAQRVALARKIERDLGYDAGESRRMADWVLDNYDLALVGSLTQIKADFSRHARA